MLTGLVCDPPQLKSRVNQDQSIHLQQQRSSLNKRNLEVAATERRLAELRQRLWKKKAALQQQEPQLVSVRRRAPLSPLSPDTHLSPRWAQWVGLRSTAPSPGWQRWGRTFSPRPGAAVRRLC